MLARAFFSTQVVVCRCPHVRGSQCKSSLWGESGGAEEQGVGVLLSSGTREHNREVRLD